MASTFSQRVELSPEKHNRLAQVAAPPLDPFPATSSSHSHPNIIVDGEPSFSSSARAPMALSSMSHSMSTAPRPRVVSDFDMSRMPVIHQRSLHPWSVHRSIATGKYIATVARYTTGSTTSEGWSYPTFKLKHAQFPFPTEREARKFCKAYSPPKFVTGHVDGCLLCHVTMTSSPSPRRHCRNCGAVICERCTQRWGVRMVPKTYVPQIATTVRVCKSCHWLSNAFCMALLQARYQDALRLYETGNVNLRSSFADIHGEAMLPIHVAVLGGSIALVRWLVDTHLCPVSVSRGAKGQLLSVQTSTHRTLLDVAMGGRPKMEILAYLIGKGLSLSDVKDSSLPTRTLETMLKGIHVGNLAINNAGSAGRAVPPVGVAVISTDEVDLMDCAESVTTDAGNDNCNLCCERPMDCVLTPCGHQICCNECAQQIRSCPICKVDCSALRIFRQ